jgi:hypothetical protein
LVAVYAAWQDPSFLVLLLPLLAFAHVYNHTRFGVSYPGWPAALKRPAVPGGSAPAGRSPHDVSAPRVPPATSKAE